MQKIFEKLNEKMLNSDPKTVAAFISDNVQNITTLNDFFTKYGFVPVHCHVDVNKGDFLRVDLINHLGLSEDLWVYIESFIGIDETNVVSVNFKLLPYIYLAPYNKTNAFEMLFFLHQYLPFSINLDLCELTLDKANPHYDHFIASIASLSMDLKSSFYQTSNRNAMYYLMSMHKADEQGYIVPFIADDSDARVITQLYESQKQLFEAKAYNELMLRIETVCLVFSAVALVKDSDFVAYCQSHGSEFVLQYLNNARHEATHKKTIFTEVVDPGFRRIAEPEDKPSLTQYGMYALAAGVAGLAAGALYCFASNQQAN